MRYLRSLNLAQNKLNDDENFSFPENIDSFLKEIPSLNLGNQRQNSIQEIKIKSHLIAETIKRLN